MHTRTHAHTHTHTHTSEQQHTLHKRISVLEESVRGKAEAERHYQQRASEANREVRQLEILLTQSEERVEEERRDVQRRAEQRAMDLQTRLTQLEKTLRETVITTSLNVFSNWVRGRKEAERGRREAEESLRRQEKEEHKSLLQIMDRMLTYL